MPSALPFRLLPLGVMLALATAGLAWGPSWSERWAAWPWLVSLVFVGLPHGAADLAVARRRLDSRGLARAAVAYLAILLATLAAFIVFPTVVLPAFVILSVWHFGVARGGFAIGVPLAVWPEATARVAGEVAAIVGHEAAFPVAVIRWLGIAILAAAVTATARETTCRAQRDGWRTATNGLLEAAVIAMLAATTDPLFSVGVFFLCWHAWREIPHLAAEIGGPSLQRDVHRPGSRVGAFDGWRPLARVHIAALPLLVPTWLALGAAWWLLPESQLGHSLRGLAILSVAAYIVVTPAHELHVAASRGAPRARWARCVAMMLRHTVGFDGVFPAGGGSPWTVITHSMLRPRCRPGGASSGGSTTGCSRGPTRGTGSRHWP